MQITQKHFLKLLIVALIGLGIFGSFLFFRGGESKKPLNEIQTPEKDSNHAIVINNQGGNMEGHTPRGFQGMGSGLFVGDNLNPGFPNNDGVQFFLTFDLDAIPSGASVTTKTGLRIASATLRSKNLHVQGSPFKDLGELKAEVISYDAFSSALWNRQSNGPACTFSVLSDNSVACAITDVIQQALDNKSRSAQFRVRFERAGDGDGNPDLALFYATDSNKNELGIFQLEITLTNASADNRNDDIHIPILLYIVKNSGLVSTARNKDNVFALFQKSQNIWNQAHIVFDTKIEEIMLDNERQKAVKQQDFEKLYAIIPTNDHALHVIFIENIGGPNGIAVAPSLALIADSTTVNDFRATAHEIGHLLGLTHTDESQERLLFRGANGTQLIPQEINLARDGAKIFANNMESRDVSFVASDGYKLSGTFWTPDLKERYSVVILSHQFNSTRHDYDAFIPILLKNGYAVLAYDTRGFGESRNGTANINDFPKDVIGTIDFLKKQTEVDSSRIGIIGASVGANVAFVVSGITQEVRAAVALSPSNTGTRGVLLGNGMPNFSPSRIFIASDEREKGDADFIFTKVSEPKEQHTYPGFGHGIGLLRSSEAQNDILLFLKRML